MRFIPASCSEPSITCYFGFVSSPSPPAVSGVISSIELEVHPEVIHRFFHRFHTLRYFCILQYRRLSPTSPKKGDSLSDPSSFGLQRSSPSSPSASSNQFPQVTSRVIHRSFLVYPIHAFALDPPSRSPKHFVRIILIRRPLLSSTPRYSSSGFNSRIPVLSHYFFFKASSLDLSHHANRSFFCSNSCSPLESRQELACATSGRRC